MNLKLEKLCYLIAWWVAFTAMIGSLYFSEVLRFPPCSLCWFQRIFTYPLVIIIPIGLWRRDKYLADYVVALSGIGTLIALYHNLLYYGIIPEKLTPCQVTATVSCTQRFIEWFGFITIPMLSLIALLLITGLMVTIMRYRKIATAKKDTV